MWINRCMAMQKIYFCIFLCSVKWEILFYFSNSDKCEKSLMYFVLPISSNCEAWKPFLAHDLRQNFLPEACKMQFISG